MLKRIIPFTFSLFFALGLIAQVPKKAIISSIDGHTAGKRAECVGNFAGNVTLSAITGSSNSNTATDSPVFLCFKDQLMVLNAGATTDGDPNSGTTGGIGYAFYRNQPTVDGSNYTTALTDPEILRDTDPTTIDSLFIFVDPNDPTGASVTFQNDTLLPNGEGLNDFFFGGAPEIIWFAPITYDLLGGTDIANYEDGGSCVTVGIAEAFPVVYLNPIEVINEQYPFGGNGSQARINVKGGFPEFDGNEFYNISIQNIANRAIVGEVINGSFGNRDFPIISVPQPGTYEIRISDGKSCDLVYTIVMDQFTNDSAITLIAEDGIGVVNGEVCIDIKVEDFDSIVGAGFFVGWDTAILDFRSVEVVLPDDDMTRNNWAFGENLAPNGVLIVNFLSQDFNLGTAYPNGTSIFQICFEGKIEGSSPVEFVDDPRSNASSTEIIHADGSIISIVNEESGIITINDPDRITGIVPPESIKDACPGEDNGSFDIQATGGIAPYEVVLTDLTSTIYGPFEIPEEGFLTITNLPPGTYTYLISDFGIGANKKFSNSDIPIEIVEANLLADAMVEKTVTCNGDDDGSMTVNIFKNGSQLNSFDDYSFIWTNLAGDTVSMEQTPTGLIADNAYTVLVSDPNGCTTSNTSPLPQTNPLMITSSITQPSCSGVEDGNIQITMVDGGQGPFNYSWSNGDTDSDNLGIAEGNYIFTVTDANGCAKTDSTLLTASIAINSNPLTTNILCFGEGNGTITLTATTNGPANSIPSANGYIFDWSPNSPINTETGSRSLLSDLDTGTYTVLITHPELPVGCELTQYYTITQPDSLIIESINITNVTSCTLSDGSASANVIGGTVANDYQYTWNDPIGQNTQTATALAPDSITIFVNDDNGCNATLDTIIGTPPPPIISLFENDSLECFDNTDGFLQVDATKDPDGARISTYQWSHDPSLSTTIAGTLSPGTYTVTVIDEDQCASVDSAIVWAPEEISFDTIIFREPCFGAEDGRISVDISGGVPNTGAQPYNLTWSTGAEGAVLADVAAGSYDLMITDAKNCSVDTEIVLNNILRIVVNFDPASLNGVDCFDNIDPADCDGTATGLATYEDGSPGIFDFTWSTGESVSGTDQASSNILCAGMQALRVSDGQCEITDSVNIPSPTQLLFDPVSSVITPVTCFGDTDGAATVAALGGTPGYTFNWPGAINGATVSAFSAGNYTITITDANNCIRMHDIEISEPDELIASIDIINTTNVICEGNDDGRIEVIIMGGNQGNLNYAWTDNVSNTPSAAGLAPGLYAIDVTDANGCTASTQYTVEEPTPITAIIDNTPILCAGFQSTISVINPQGGNGGVYSFSVDNSPGLPPVFGGAHTVSVFDSRNCQIDFEIEILEPLELMIEFPENLVEVDLGSSITLTPNIISSLPIADLQWTIGGASVDSTFICNSVLCDNPTVNPLNNTSYTLMVTDQNGCFAEETIMVDVDKNRNVYIPNIFAPNGTGFDTNDKFQVFTGSGVRRIKSARVFNRWGTMVAGLEEMPPSSSGITIWDGLIRGQKANQGVYIYIIEVEFIDKQPDDTQTTLLYRGDITLLR